VRATVYISVNFLPAASRRSGRGQFPRFVHTRKDEAYSAPLDDIINVADGVNFADLLHRYISLAADLSPPPYWRCNFLTSRMKAGPPGDPSVQADGHQFVFPCVGKGAFFRVREHDWRAVGGQQSEDGQTGPISGACG